MNKISTSLKSRIPKRIAVYFLKINLQKITYQLSRNDRQNIHLERWDSRKLTFHFRHDLFSFYGYWKLFGRFKSHRISEAANNRRKEVWGSWDEERHEVAHVPALHLLGQRLAADEDLSGTSSDPCMAPSAEKTTVWMSPLSRCGRE